MTNLTEQWSNGELQKKDWYYVLCKNNQRRIKEYNCFSKKKEFKEVLGKVPTYEEWQQSMENTKWLDWKSAYIVQLEEENTKLKELLAECRSVIHGAFLVCSKEMCDKIDEVLEK